jgi:RNA polymerase sigma-70 factor (ECF subfamily)
VIRSEGELLAAHLAGDPRAFGELTEVARRYLWATARTALDDPRDIDEAVQDTMLRALRGAERFRGECSVPTWLTRIMLNVCRDRLRRERRRPVVPLPPDNLDDLIGAGPDAAAAVAARLDLWAALDRLPAHQRLPILLVEVYGYPVAEVAEMLALPVGTVKSRCHRGRERLHALLVPTPAHRDVEEAAR